MDAECARVLASVAVDHRQVVVATCGAIQSALARAGLLAEVIPFGSTVSGLAVEDDCDVDVCLVCGPHASDMPLPPHQRMRATAQRACDALVSVAGARQMVPILSARVPILKFELPGGAGAPIPRLVPVDLCFNNLNGCRNSELCRLLAALEPRFRPLAMLVKLWAKRRGLVDSSRGLFSSYAVVLLVVHFLQGRGLLPSGAAFAAIADGVAGFTPADTLAWVISSPMPQRSAAALERELAPPCVHPVPVEVERAVRQMASADPSLNAKKLFALVKAQRPDPP